ncbi:hypothetical protein PGT21_009259 [Puccinia graminis f. sp. tritici]|uniref:Uncharacterized protein n=1 Tax=Puccinia graminis f. sp. tritici TaxID=56615 RepID=A0A5B0QW01_PUCGR|nr:hypothetical protein PGT21_009259 [Puccinia graminis f. sp. tritici]
MIEREGSIKDHELAEGVTPFDTECNTKGQSSHNPQDDHWSSPTLTTLAEGKLKDSPEEYIEEILSPVKITGFPRKRTELPESEEERKFLIKQMNKEFTNLKKEVDGVKYLMDKKDSRSFQIEKTLFKQYAPKLDDVHMQLPLLMRNRIANLKGKKSTISIIPQMNDKPTSCKIRHIDKSQTDESLSNFDTTKKSRETPNNEKIMKLDHDGNDENGSSTGSTEDQTLDEDLSKTILQKLGII